MKRLLFLISACILLTSGCSPYSSNRSNNMINEPIHTSSISSPTPAAITAPTTPDSPASLAPAVPDTPTAVTSAIPTNTAPVTPDSPTPKETRAPGGEKTEGDETTSYPKEDSQNADYQMTQSLKGKIICIDPGHGNPKIKGKQEKIAPDSEETKPALVYGAVGIATKTPEYKVNMSISLKLKSLLEAQGSIVILTRQNNDENLGNIDRAIIGNDAQSDLVIRIHADSSTNPKANGVSVLFPDNKYISDTDLLKKSESAAQLVHDAIISASGAKPRGIIKREDLTGFNWSTRPTILVEMGFLSNHEEDKLLNDPTYQDKIVDGIFTGMLGYFKAQ